MIIISIVWEDKEPDTTSIPIENTTEIFTTKDADEQQESRFKLAKKKDDTLSATEIDSSLPEDTLSMPKQDSGIFTLTNTVSESLSVAYSGQDMLIQEVEQPIVMVNLFATWCPPCIGEIPYLNDLQKKHQKELFIAGVLTHDSIDRSALETFMAKNQINYYISNGAYNDALANHLAIELHLSENFPLPLTAIFVNGEYFTHYEGTVPVEMIEYDIQQAKKQLKSR